MARKVSPKGHGPMISSEEGFYLEQSIEQQNNIIIDSDMTIRSVVLIAYLQIHKKSQESIGASVIFQSISVKTPRLREVGHRCWRDARSQRLNWLVEESTVGHAHTQSNLGAGVTC